MVFIVQYEFLAIVCPLKNFFLFLVQIDRLISPTQRVFRTGLILGARLVYLFYIDIWFSFFSFLGKETFSALPAKTFLTKS
jgi:hypothetical protein